MFLEWSLLTVVSLSALFFLVKMFYFRSIALKEQRSSEMMKVTIKEAEALIRKYQVQLQRSLGNIDILSEELDSLRKELKACNSKHRAETDRLQNKIKELEGRISALI